MQARELFSRNDEAFVNIKTARSESSLSLPPPVAVPGGPAISFVGAWTSLSKQEALPSGLQITNAGLF
jgi:hypothetical protein